VFFLYLLTCRLYYSDIQISNLHSHLISLSHSSTLINLATTTSTKQPPPEVWDKCVLGQQHSIVTDVSQRLDGEHQFQGNDHHDSRSKFHIFPYFTFRHISHFALFQFSLIFTNMCWAFFDFAIFLIIFLLYLSAWDKGKQEWEKKVWKMIETQLQGEWEEKMYSTYEWGGSREERDCEDDCTLKVWWKWKRMGTTRRVCTLSCNLNSCWWIFCSVKF